MSYSRDNLYQIGPGGSSPRLWIYSSTTAIAAVNSAGFFNSAADLLSVRDVIIVVDTSTPTTNLVNVLSNDGTTVDVSDGTAIAETDGD
jgi:accessory colonization factor AcfC